MVAILFYFWLGSDYGLFVGSSEVLWGSEVLSGNPECCLGRD